ncbi:MAG: hypothetical protein COS89_08395, partial [Deltaproteobacteria bacterium CG07_land_8_20_14_0_80_38_7]
NYFLVVDPAGIRTTGYRNTVTYLILDNGKGAIPGEEGTNNYYVDVLFYLSSLYVKENSRVHITSLHLSYSSKAVDNGYDLDTNGIIDLDSLFTTDADGNSRIVDIADSAALGLTGDYAIGDGTNDIDIGAKEFAVGTPEGNGGPDATEYSGYNDILCAMVDGSTSASCAQVEGVCSVDTACSLERAMDAALSKNGSVPTIYLMDGTYDDNITLRKEVHLQSENHWGATISPTYGGPVTVLSGVNNNAVIDGLRIIPKDETASAAAIKIINSGSPTITNNLLMPNAHTSSRTDYGIYLYNASPTSIKIDGNTIVGFQEAGVYLYNADGAAFVAGLDDESDQIVIKNNSFSKNYGYNLNITNGASNILIYNNIFTGNYGTYGIYMYNSYPIYIMNNTLYANQLSTYVVRSTIVNTYVLENNIIANNTSATLYCDQGTQGTNISYNLIYGNSNNTGGYSSCTGGTDDNQIFADTLGFAEESGTTATIDTVTFDGDTVYVTFSESLGWEPSQYAATTSNKYFLITEDGEDEATNGFVITDNGENDVYLLYYDEGNDNDELVAGNTVHITQMKLSNDSEAANAGNPNTDDFIDLDTLWTLDIWGDTRVADGNIDIGAVESTLVPEAPTILFVDDTDASAGSENPTNLTKLAPVMSALCNTPTNCISAEIQVASDSDFLSLVWESGEIDVVDKNDGERIGDITYSGDALDYNTTYYWRIRMYSINSYGSWSTANTFEIPRALEFYNFDLGGAVQEDTSETIKWGSFGGNDTVTISYSTDDCNTKTEIASVVSSPNAPDTTQTQSWTIPNAADVCGASTCDTVKLCLDTSVGNHSAMSEEYFTIQAADGAAGIKYSRTFSDSNFSDLSGATSATISGGDVTFAAGDWGGDYVSYTNRKAITITEKSGSELTDFQVQVDVTYEDSMQVDFDDVRFTDSDGTTSLNYWLETKTDSTSATFWVKVPSIKTSSTATIYMYYGNGSAESVSDGAATFEFFDDFSGSAIDETKWVITNATGFSVADGLLTGTSTTGRLTSVNTFSEPIVIEARQIVNTVQTTSGHMVIGTYLSTSNAIGLIPTGDQTIWYRNNGQWLGAYSTAPAIATSWATYKLAAASGTVSLSMKNDDDSEYLGSTSNTISSEPIAISKRYSDDYTGYTYDADWDWIRTRQYASTEPTSEIGSEETYTPPADQVVLYAAPDTIGIVSNFAATSSGTGTVTFRISDDNGVTWYYCSGDTLTEGATKNTAAELTNNCLDDLSGESFNVETTLSVSLGQTATLSDISYNITYIPSVSFTSASQQAAENAGNITITAELSSVYGSDVTIPYTITGTATDNTDYSITASPLVITAGNTTGDVTISITSDTADEENETVIVTMGELINATAGEITEHTAAILDDDNPPAISINDIAVDEGDADSTTATFTVSLSTASGKTVTVDYASADNTAEAGSDYTAKGTTTLTFNAGETEQSATVSVLGDVLDEDNETFYVNLSNASNGTISDSQGAGTITDDDATPTLNIDDKTVGEADGTVQFTITLSAASGKAVSVDYATGDSSALAGSDYTAASNTATIAAGETTAVVNITIANDTIDEDDEIFNVNLTNPSNATIADAQGVGTITDDDLAPTLSITDVDVTEGNSGSVAATFAVSLSAVSGKVITVAYATANGTALAGADYTATSGTLSFSAGESAKNIVVSVTGDTMDEDNEAYTVVLSDPSNATILDASGIGTITDDDATPSISLSTISSSVAEGASAVIIAELSAASGKVITVPITTGGTATLTTDYTYTPSSLSFAAGETSKTITVSAVDDSTSESSEAAIFTLGSPTNASLGSNKIYTLTITGTSGTFALTFGSATGCTGTSSLTCLVNEGDAISIPITGATHSSITITTNPLPSGALFSSTQLGTSRSGTFTWTPADGTEGSYTIIFTGIAGNGETDSKTALINVVKGDTLPTVSLSTSDNTKVAGGTVILTANAVDADGDPLTYHWMKTSGEGPSVESNTGSLLAFTIPSLSSLPGNRQGMVFAFKVTVEDDDGNEAFDTIIIRGMKPSIVAGEDSAETTTELVEGDVIDYANIDGSMLAVKVAEVDGTNSLITIENDSEVLYTYE